MLALLIALLLGVAVLAVFHLLLMWAARVEQRADDRHLMGRVYFPTRGRKAGVSARKRRRRPGDVGDW